jgi:GntR family transcriptional regulator/MocR family aminotransferase
MYLGSMSKRLNLSLDRAARIPLNEQIRRGVATAIEDGVLEPGARLPSWQDLSAQLGVARGTVKTAYEKLAASQLVEASRVAGTRVAKRPRTSPKAELTPAADSFMSTYQEMTRGPALFQMGIPDADNFPATLFARIRAHAVRAEASAPPLYPDPRGAPRLRREFAAYLAVARGISCLPSQIIITGGFSAGLGLALATLRLSGHTAWFEEPGFLWSRKGLELAGLTLAPIPVDADGIDVDHGVRHHPDARLAVVTPGQQAPLGFTLSLERRLRLLEWAAETKAWVIEDDYLSELRLSSGAAPALASLDRDGRVIHIGSFSKTISPVLRLGFRVAPPELAARFAEVAACLAPAPARSAQFAMTEFMSEGHYLRHLRRTKRAYAAKRDVLLECLGNFVDEDQATTAGLTVLLKLEKGASDIAIAREASAFGMSPGSLSAWYASDELARPGLLLGIATSPKKNLAQSCERLFETIRRFGYKQQG